MLTIKVLASSSLLEKATFTSEAVTTVFCVSHAFPAKGLSRCLRPDAAAQRFYLQELAFSSSSGLVRIHSLRASMRNL